MNLTIPADFPVERVQKALASEGLAIRAEIKHGETRHVLTESPAPGPMGDARKPCGNGTSREAGTPHANGSFPARADRVAHETREPSNAAAYAVDVFQQMTGRRSPAPVGYCEECGDPCHAHEVDFGHGEARYNGAVSKQIVSKCCDATIFEDQDMTIEYEPEA